MIVNRDLRSTRRRQAAGAGRTQHRVSLEVAEPQARFDDFGTLRDGRADSAGFFATKRPFAATPQQGQPMLAVLVACDPRVDRSR